MRFGARVSKTPCQTLYPWVSVLARCFAYACTKSHQNRSKFGGDIAQINAHRFLLSPINFIINSTSQRPWEQKGQKTRVTPYARRVAIERLRVGPWCAAHVTATMLPPACWAVVCCLHCRRAARRVAIECMSGHSVLPASPPLPCCPLRVGPWCAAHVATAAALTIVSPSSGCVLGRGVLPAS